MVVSNNICEAQIRRSWHLLQHDDRKVNTNTAIEALPDFSREKYWTVAIESYTLDYCKRECLSSKSYSLL